MAHPTPAEQIQNQLSQKIPNKYINHAPLRLLQRHQTQAPKLKIMAITRLQIANNKSSPSNGCGSL